MNSKIAIISKKNVKKNRNRSPKFEFEVFCVVGGNCVFGDVEIREESPHI